MDDDDVRFAFSIASVSGMSATLGFLPDCCEDVSDARALERLDRSPFVEFDLSLMSEALKEGEHMLSR